MQDGSVSVERRKRGPDVWCFRWREAGLGGKYGGISLEVPASASAVDGIHFMYDEEGKFSASLEMFSRDPNATVLQRTGSDQKQWTIRAPMLALLNPDPALGLSTRTKLQPTIFMRNTTARNVLAEIMLSWRGDSGKGQAKLPSLQLAPFATQELQIWAKQKQLGIPEDAHWALVSLTTTAAPDDVIAIASSRDCNGVYNVETQFTGGMGGHYAGAEWRTDATHNQIAAITNVGEQPADALLTLHYDKGVRSYELQQTIAPGDQMWVNLAELIRQRVPDRNGTVLPVAVSVVTYGLQDLTPGAHSLMVNALAVNSVTGRAVPNCPQCCPFYDIAFSPQDLFLQIGQQYPLLIDGLDGCNNSIYDLNPYFQNWSPSNPSIVTVTNKEQAQALGVGSATVLATGSVPEPGPCGCSFSFKEPETNVNVGPTVTIDSFTPNPIPSGGTANAHITVNPSANVDLSITNTSKGAGTATFGTSGKTTLTIPETTTVNITAGNQSSNGVPDLTLTASYQGNYLTSINFSVTSGACSATYSGHGGDGGKNCPTNVSVYDTYSLQAYCGTCTFQCVPINYDSTFTPNNCSSISNNGPLGSGNATFTSTQYGNFAATDCNWHYLQITTTVTNAQGVKTPYTTPTKTMGLRCTKYPNGSPCP